MAAAAVVDAVVELSTLPLLLLPPVFVVVVDDD
jgi:hypothetical protein